MIARSKATIAFLRMSYHKHTGTSAFIVHVGGDYDGRTLFSCGGKVLYLYLAADREAEVVVEQVVPAVVIARPARVDGVGVAAPIAHLVVRQ